MNKWSGLGRLTKDIDLKYTQGGTAVASFTLAVNRRFKKEGEQQADFISIIAWGKTAEFCGNYLKKGMQLSVVGRIQTRNYENQEGKKVYITEVIAEEVYPIWEKKNNNSETTNTYENSNENMDTSFSDDLPF